MNKFFKISIDYMQPYNVYIIFHIQISPLNDIFFFDLTIEY